jgi:hypothetical protein
MTAMSDDPIYTLIVKADTDWKALEELDANGIAVGRFHVEAVPDRPERLLTVEFAYGDGSEWGHDVDSFRRVIERRLNHWLVRDKHEYVDGFGFPMGSLLWWERE